MKIWRRGEGFTVGASSGCTPVRIEDSFAKISIYDCNAMDWHSDGIQGYDGNALTVRNLTIDFNEVLRHRAVLLSSAQPGQRPRRRRSPARDGRWLLVPVGHLGDGPNLKIVDESWGYGPIDVRCSALSAWDASLVTITSNYQDRAHGAVAALQHRDGRLAQSLKTKPARKPGGARSVDPTCGKTQ